MRSISRNAVTFSLFFAATSLPVLFRLGRGSGWRIGGCRIFRSTFGLADGGDTFYIELLVVRISRNDVDFEAFHKQDANADVSLLVGRQPDFIINEGLLEDEARALLQVGKHATSELEVADEIGLETRDIVRLLIDPDDARELLHDFFFQLVRFEVGIRLEVKD